MAPNSSGTSGSDPRDGSAVSLGDSSASSSIVEQARGRSDGFEMGGDRAIVNPPNWNSQESNQLYQAATMNNDPASAATTGQAWAAHGRELSEASDNLYNAISELGAVWVGLGAAAAQGALVAIANSSSQASEAAHTMANRLEQQAAAAAEVKKMPLPVDYDPAKSMTAALAGGPAAMIADQKAQADAAADVKAQQVAFFNAYTNALSEVDGSTPSFGPESLGMKPMSGTSATNFNQVGGVAQLGGGYSGLDHGAGGSFGTTSGFGSGATGVDAGYTTQAGYTPAASAAGVGSAPAASAPMPSVPTASSGGSHLGSALGMGAVGGALGAAGARPLGQGNRSGAKSASDQTSAANDPVGQAQGGTSAAPASGLVSPGGTVGGASMASPPVTGGMGVGGAHRHEDEEYAQASFLIAPDPDEFFGTDQATSPPVIGMWAEEDER